MKFGMSPSCKGLSKTAGLAVRGDVSCSRGIQEVSRSLRALGQNYSVNGVFLGVKVMLMIW